MIKLLTLTILVAVSCALEIDTLATHISSLLTGIVTSNCQVAVSDDLISFYCPNQNILLYYIRSQYENGNYSSMKTKTMSILLGFKEATQHVGGSKYIVTSGLKYTSEFYYYAYLEAGDIKIDSKQFTTTYELMAFGNNLLVGAKGNSPSTWVIGTILPGSEVTKTKATTVSGVTVSKTPTGMAVRDLSTNTARVYYTLQNSADSNYGLYVEDIDLYFLISSPKSMAIGNNCGNKITVNSKIIVLS